MWSTSITIIHLNLKIEDQYSWANLHLIVNPPCPDPIRRKKISLNLYFHASFETPQGLHQTF